jgi:biopolymer transport protein ExbD
MRAAGFRVLSARLRSFSARAPFSWEFPRCSAFAAIREELPKPSWRIGSNCTMATIDSGGGARRARSTNHELPLVPFIDFLLCLVTFLLATAGFANFARLASSANVPGKLSDVPEAQPKRLHVDVREHVFHVTWQSGATVLVSNDVPVTPVELARGGRRYPELAQFLERDFRVNGSHRDPNDPALDEAILHVRNSAEYEDVVAVLDALRAPQRAYPNGKQESAFAVSFAAD